MNYKSFIKKFLWGSASFAVCLTFYLSLAWLLLGGGKTDANTDVKDVPYENYEDDFSMLLACDELEQFCGIMVYPREKMLTAILFDTRTDAESYQNDYTYRVEYAKKTEIDLIGRIGGIVISDKNSYNVYTNSYSQAQRLFGSRVLELAKDPSLRKDIAYELLYSSLGTNLNEEDFGYILASCNANLSCKKICELFGTMQQMRENITIMIG